MAAHLCCRSGRPGPWCILKVDGRRQVPSHEDTIGERKKTSHRSTSRAKLNMAKIDRSRAENSLIGKSQMTGLVGEQQIMPVQIVYDENKDKLNMSTDAIYKRGRTKLQAKAAPIRGHASIWNLATKIKLVDAKIDSQSEEPTRLSSALLARTCRDLG